jgi:hypothetical protein
LKGIFCPFLVLIKRRAARFLIDNNITVG